MPTIHTHIPNFQGDRVKKAPVLLLILAANSSPGLICPGDIICTMGTPADGRTVLRIVLKGNTQPVTRVSQP